MKKIEAKKKVILQPPFRGLPFPSHSSSRPPARSFIPRGTKPCALTEASHALASNALEGIDSSSLRLGPPRLGEGRDRVGGLLSTPH